MCSALYTETPNEVTPDCPLHHARDTRWLDELPTPLKDLVVTPTSFQVHQEYEIRADHTFGCDAANKPCYCAFRFVQTQLRSDDDEVFYEAPVCAETLTSWRLLDERWLVCRTTVGSFDAAASETSFSVSDAMPR